jgi:hypothetical protein
VKLGLKRNEWQEKKKKKKEEGDMENCLQHFISFYFIYFSGGFGVGFWEFFFSFPLPPQS